MDVKKFFVILLLSLAVIIPANSNTQTVIGASEVAYGFGYPQIPRLPPN